MWSSGWVRAAGPTWPCTTPTSPQPGGGEPNRSFLHRTILSVLAAAGHVPQADAGAALAAEVARFVAAR